MTHGTDPSEDTRGLDMADPGTGETDTGEADVRAVRVSVATVWTSPDAPREVDRPAVLDEPDVPAWTAGMDATVRKGLAGRTLTQLLAGETVRVVEERGDWTRLVCPEQPSSQDPEGYPGWVRRAHLGTPVAGSAGAVAVVTVPTAAAAADGRPLHLSFGTRAPVGGSTDRAVRLVLPGRQVEVARDDVVVGPETRAAYTVDDVLARARLFLGLRYLWGGTSAWGLDCSGLVHLVHRSLGVTLPRDAFDQATAVEPVPLEEVRAGDLYFFARPGEPIYHVGFASRPYGGSGERWMLHAPEGGELIEDAPMAKHRLGTLVAAGRVGPVSSRGSLPL